MNRIDCVATVLIVCVSIQTRYLCHLCHNDTDTQYCNTVSTLAICIICVTFDTDKQYRNTVLRLATCVICVTMILIHGITTSTTQYQDSLQGGEDS